MPAPAKPPEGKPPIKLSDPVAVMREGDRFLLVERADFDKKDWNGWAQVHDLERKPPQLSDCKWTQVWGKFGVWQDCTDRAYRNALKRRGLE